MKDLGLQSLNGLYHTGIIKSVQYTGSVNIPGVTSQTATLPQAVDVNNSMLFWLGYNNTRTGYDPTNSVGRVALTDSVTVTFTRPSTTGTTSGSAVVIEFYPGVIRSVQ